VEISPAYGAVSRRSSLSAEDILKRCLREQPGDLPETMLMESFGGSSWKAVLGPGRRMVNKLEESLARLGDLSAVEVFMAPKSLLFPSRLLAAGLAAQIESGQAGFVGVQGVTRAGSLRRLRRLLEDRDVALTCCSFDFSLTRPASEDMIDACKALGVVPICTDPLDGGLASGVYTAANPSGGQAGVGGGRFSFQQLEKLQPLHSVQETVAERVRTRVVRNVSDTQQRYRGKYGPPPEINTDITTTQVALHWIIAKGGVPLAPVNSPAQADEVLGCLGWTLTDEEVDMIDAAVALCKL
jgi:aryl-alcohol dehydrogenase-like predicted oxidoreductase